MNKSAIEKIYIVDINLNIIIIYDNFDFAKDRRGERVENI